MSFFNFYWYFTKLTTFFLTPILLPLPICDVVNKYYYYYYYSPYTGVGTPFLGRFKKVFLCQTFVHAVLGKFHYNLNWSEFKIPILIPYIFIFKHFAGIVNFPATFSLVLSKEMVILILSYWIHTYIGQTFDKFNRRQRSCCSAGLLLVLNFLKKWS